MPPAPTCEIPPHISARESPRQPELTTRVAAVSIQLPLNKLSSMTTVAVVTLPLRPRGTGQLSKEMVRMPPSCAVILVAAALLAQSDDVAAQSAQTFKARLSPVPLELSQLSTIAGTGTITSELAGMRLTLSGTFEGLRSPATVARVHKAQMGLRGPAVFDLTVTQAVSGTVRGSLTLSAAQVEDLKRSRYYVQIHSEQAPEGNLRGWLIPEENRP
jgi:hypothetical protein